MRTTILLFAAALAAGALLAPAASAATTFGNSCEAGEALDENVSLVDLSRNGGSPVSGVVTEWKMNPAVYPVGLTQRLKIFRLTPTEEAIITVGESAVEPVSAAEKGVSTRIPIAAGDRLGLAAQGDEPYVLYCVDQASDEALGLIEGDPAVGTTEEVVDGETEIALPVTVQIEPDADNDGYGDETQDQCPTNAATQGPCPIAPPPPTPHPSGKTVAHKGSVTVKASTDVAGPVTVSGKVKLGKGKSATLNGGTQTLAAGQQGSFTLKFTKKLKAKLAALPAKQKLKLAVTISAAGAGVPGAQTLTVKLPGQG